MKRDFASLSPREALRIAIVIEERNAHVYRRLGDMFSKSCSESSEVASTFYDLANVEEKHRALVAAHYSERFGAVIADITEEDIVDSIEVPQLDLADILVAVETGDVPAARRMAFEMALATEREAAKYYTGLVEATSDPDLNLLYKELLAFEEEHTDALNQALDQPGRSLGRILPTQAE